ncbi:MAG TPA: hypothetical protein VFU15_09225 [Bacteroidia bacterium]|nr:hypothetical protein [Bacteroidia bacterium]
MKKRFWPALLSVPVAVLALTLNSCNNDNSDKNGVDTMGDTTSAVEKKDTIGNQEFAQVPSPSEMFAFMKAAAGGNASADVLNPVENEKKYESQKAQSLNLGVYSADLLYCSTFSVSNKVVPYFGTCMRMGDKLKVATDISDKDKDRISKNAGNADSLVAISNDLYLTTFENLDQNQRGDDLGLMLAGGWVESLYLMTNMVKDFDKDKATVDGVVQQKGSLDNLVDYLSKHESNPDVKAVSDQLKELKALFDAVPVSTTASGMTMKNGKHVLGGGSKPTPTKDQFEKIKSKVADIRNGFISAQ